ncbi:MAG: hypothetical protein ACFFAN_16720 [Promethearchaeota archaeon]
MNISRVEKRTQIIEFNEDLSESKNTSTRQNNQILKENNIKSFDITGAI